MSGTSFTEKTKAEKVAEKKKQAEARIQNKIARDEARKAKFEAIKKEKMEKVIQTEKSPDSQYNYFRVSGSRKKNGSRKKREKEAFQSQMKSLRRRRRNSISRMHK